MSMKVMKFRQTQAEHLKVVMRYHIFDVLYIPLSVFDVSFQYFLYFLFLIKGHGYPQRLSADGLGPYVLVFIYL